MVTHPCTFPVTGVHWMLCVYSYNIRPTLIPKTRSVYSWYKLKVEFSCVTVSSLLEFVHPTSSGMLATASWSCWTASEAWSQHCWRDRSGKEIRHALLSSQTFSCMISYERKEHGSARLLWHQAMCTPHSKYHPCITLLQHRNTSLHFACDKNDAALVRILLKCTKCQVYKHNAVRVSVENKIVH